jgi:FAD binding domain
MAEHVRFTVDTGVAVYFCDPHSPWQRGSNENTNRLLRQYLPKGSDLRQVTKDQLHATQAWVRPARRYPDCSGASPGHLRVSRDLDGEDRQPLLAACLRAGVKFLLEATLRAIEQDAGGRVIGAAVSVGGQTHHLRARCGVVLATGGYDHNPEMQRQFDPHPPAVAFTKPTVDGSGLQAAMNVGASFANVLGQLMSPGYVLPAEGGGDPIVGNVAGREPSFPGSIVVNGYGRRFADDSFYRALVMGMSHFDAKTCRFDNLPAYLVFDEEWKRTYRLGYVRPGDVPGWMPRGENPRGLADALGVPGDALERTISGFNLDAAAGRDRAFGRGSMAWTRNNGDSRVPAEPVHLPPRRHAARGRAQALLDGYAFRSGGG